MVRAERNQPDIYFGRPGYLVQLPWPRGDVDSPFDRLTHDFVTGAGQHQVAQLLGGSRLYTLNWEALHVDNYRKIEQYYLGHMGVGPWCIIDPSRPNLLMPNQSATTAVWNTTRDFYVALNNGVLSSNSDATYIHRTGSTRSLRWLFSGTLVTFPGLYLSSPYRGWFGIPVQTGLSYVFSGWIRSRDDVGTIALSPKINWKDAAGVSLSISSPADYNIGAAWTRISVTGVAPANAAYAEPLIGTTASSITSGASLYLDELMLEQDTVLNDWAPGTGVRPVQILNLTDSTPFAARFRQKPVMTLRELAQ